MTLTESSPANAEMLTAVTAPGVNCVTTPFTVTVSLSPSVTVIASASGVPYTLTVVPTSCADPPTVRVTMLLAWLEPCPSSTWKLAVRAAGLDVDSTWN